MFFLLLLKLVMIVLIFECHSVDQWFRFAIDIYMGEYFFHLDHKLQCVEWSGSVVKLILTVPYEDSLCGAADQSHRRFLCRHLIG